MIDRRALIGCLVSRDVCSPNGDWWVAVDPRTGRQGYIPSNYVVKDDDAPESEE